MSGVEVERGIRRDDLVARFRAYQYRNEVTALVLLSLSTVLFPRSLPFGIFVLGGVGAAALALNAIAVVLVYRANRFANFAQIQLAVFCATVFASLVQGQFFLNVARSVCGCVSRQPSGVSVTANYLLAMVVAVATGAVLSYAFYATLLRRFTQAPRLMLTLFTVFAAQALAAAQRPVRRWFVPPDMPVEVLQARPTTPPWDFTWRIDDYAELHFGDVFLVGLAVAALFGIARYLQASDVGVAIRAASENPSRARTLGVDVAAVTGRVWLIAGLLAGVTGVVLGFGTASSQAISTSMEQVGILLFVAILARYESLPVLAAAAVVIGIVRVAVSYSFGSSAPLEAVLVFLVGGMLLVQRYRDSRADREDAAGFEVAREVRPIPKELRHLPQVKAWVRNGSVLAAIVLLGLPWALPGSDTTLATIYVIYSIVGLSVLVVTGWAGQVSLGQFGFAAIGAWGAAVSGLPMPLALLVGGTLGAVAAVVVGVPALRLKGLNLAVSTLAFAVSATVLFLGDRYLGKMLPESLDRPSFLGMDFEDPRVFYYASVLIVIGVTFAVVGLRRSRTGRALIALRANEAAAQSFGINVLRVRLTAFAISGFLAAFAGALFAFHQRDVNAASFAPDKSLEMFIFSVVGGLGGIAGAFCGFTFMALLRFMDDNPVITYLGGGLGGMLILMAAPGGLAQILYDIRDAALRRLAVRLRIPVPSLMGDRAAARTFDRAPLDENRRMSRSALALPLRYRLPHQWALDRFADGDGNRRRAGSPTVGRSPS